LGYGYSLDGEKYLPAPSTTSETGDELDSTDTANSDANTYSLSFGAKINETTPAGVYSNSYMLTAVANEAAYSITYDANAGTRTVTNMPDTNPQTTGAVGAELILSSDVPVRSGYSFLGWDTNSEATEATYAAGGTYPLDQTTVNYVTLYAIWQELPFRVIYDGNNADAGSMSSQVHEGLYGGSSLQLRASNYSRSGYGFIGWSPDPEFNHSNASDTPIYGPNQTAILPSYEDYGQVIDEQNTIVLYAVWVESAGSLQSYSCDLSEGEVSALTDERDGETYAIAGLADGKCWMVENLRIGSDVSATNMSTGSALTGGNFTKLPAPVITDWASNTENDTYGPNADGNTYTRRELPQLNDNNTNRELVANATSEDNSSSWWSYGNYYSWASAKANTASMNTTAQSDAQSTSICPTGWHLPTGNEGGEYPTLLSAMEEGIDTSNPTYATSSAVARSYPNNFVLGGIWSGTTAIEKNYLGIYWSASAYNADNTYRFVVGTANAAGVSNNRKWNGYSVRCVSDEGYKIIYNANNGTAERKSITYSMNNSNLTLASDLFTKDFYSFYEWNTEPDGSGTSYSAGGNYAIPEEASIGDSVNLYAIWQINPYTLRYRPNNGSGSMESVGNPNLYEGDLTTLSAPGFKRTGYAFVGWSLDPDDDPDDTDGTIHGPNEDINAPNYETYGEGHNVYEYAIWKQSDGNMQSFSCNNLNVNETVALTDTRDGETYLVTKHADNKCWMSENLRLDITTANIDNSNTNNPTSTFLTDLPTYSSSAVSCTETNASCINSAVFNTDNITNGLGNVIYNRYEYGVYYNWYTATGGNGVRGVTGQANGDICPKGWRLPTKSEYDSLISSTGATGGAVSSALRSFPYNFTNSGRITGEGLTGPAVLGVYWTAQGNTANTAFRFVLGSSETKTESYYKTGVYTIRCVAKVSETFTLTFDANGGDESTVPDSLSSATTIDTGTYTFTLSDTIPVRSGFSFTGWQDDYGTEISAANIATGNATYFATHTNTTLRAMWDCNSNSICYHGNGDDGTGSMEVQTTDLTELTASNFSRADYGFIGWSADPEANPNDTDVTIYGSNATIDSDLSASGLDLYAVWVPVEKDANNTELTFQTTNLLSTTLADGASTLSNKPVGYVTALRDNRDNDVYAVAKLADGNYWMIENLRLDPSGKTLDSTNTNNPTANFTSQASVFSASTYTPCSVEYPYPTYSGSDDCLNQIALTLDNLAGENRWYSYGTMYNLYTATAGNSQATYNESSVYTDGDICPAGWHLPYGTSAYSGVMGLDGVYKSFKPSGGYDYLHSKFGGTYSSTIWRSYPNNFIYSGGYNTNYSDDRSFGVYSAGTIDDDVGWIDLFLLHGEYAVSSDNGEEDISNQAQMAVRCVASNGVGTINYGANGGSGTILAQTNALFDNATASNNSFTPPAGKVFEKWNTRADGSGVDVYAKEFVAPAVQAEGITNGGTLTLYAQWTEQ